MCLRSKKKMSLINLESMPLYNFPASLRNCWTRKITSICGYVKFSNGSMDVSTDLCHVLSNFYPILFFNVLAATQLFQVAREI